MRITESQKNCHFFQTPFFKILLMWKSCHSFINGTLLEMKHQLQWQVSWKPNLIPHWACGSRVWFSDWKTQPVFFWIWAFFSLHPSYLAKLTDFFVFLKIDFLTLNLLIYKVKYFKSILRNQIVPNVSSAPSQSFTLW